MDHGLTNLSISKRQTLREEVYETLKKAILRGQIRSGQRLIEEQLAAALGASRTPIREAIHKLEKDELVVRLPRGGFSVRQFTVEDMEEIFGIRSVLESHAAVLATKHITPERFRLLEKKIEKSRGCLTKGDVAGLVRLNTEFHDTLYKSGGSKHLYRMISSLRDYFYRYRVAILSVDGMPEMSIQDHRDMLEAMKAGNSAKVDRLVRRHILRGKDIVVQQIRAGTLRL
jgi:DNA-binding GntR family transcriptional regulator